MNLPRSVLISNRGPDFVTGESIHRSQGGTSDAYRALASRISDLWLCLASDGLGSAPAISDFGHKLQVLYVEDAIYQRYYNGFISQYLYPILLDCPEQAISLHNYVDYLRVSDLIISELRTYLPMRLLLCDYHLFRIPLLVDWPCEKVFFWFLPFLGVSHHYPMHREIVDSLSRCDLVFFYLEEYVENFLDALRYYFPGRSVTCRPIALVSGPDRAFLETDGLSVRDYQASLRSHFDVLYSRDHAYCLSVSRLDFVKNIPMIVQGFDRFLAMRNSGAHVYLLIVAPPHRQDSAVYVEELERIRNVISGSPFRESIALSHRRFNRDELKILYKYSDVMIIGSRFDGMPITALEYILANSGQGAVVASDTTGCARFLTQDAYRFVSGEPDDLARTLFSATSAPKTDLENRMSHAKLVTQEVTVDRWITRVEQILRD